MIGNFGPFMYYLKVQNSAFYVVIFRAGFYEPIFWNIIKGSQKIWKKEKRLKLLLKGSIPNACTMASQIVHLDL